MNESINDKLKRLDDRYNDGIIRAMLTKAPYVEMEWLYREREIKVQKILNGAEEESVVKEPMAGKGLKKEYSSPKMEEYTYLPPNSPPGFSFPLIFSSIVPICQSNYRK